MTPQESETRVDLAACYRLLARLGWTDLIYTHVSARVPGEDAYLLNPYGLLFGEVTASNLIKVGLDGRVRGNRGTGPNAAGVTLHGAILAARPEVVAVVHTHTVNGMAFSCLKEGLLPITQAAMQFDGQIAYHDYANVDRPEEEAGSIVRDLGEKHVLVLRNHGLATLGRSVGEAFVWMHQLEMAIEVQLRLAATGCEIVQPPRRMVEFVAREAAVGRKDENGRLEWQALLRSLDSADSSFRQ